jgi:hypothetical protein
VVPAIVGSTDGPAGRWLDRRLDGLIGHPGYCPPSNTQIEERC